MVTYLPSVRLHNEQYRRIHEGLRLIGPGPAAFYQDACRIMEAEPPFEAATHLVSHCLRELESALRDVLRPVAAQLLPPVTSATSATQSKKPRQKQAGVEKDGHQKDILQILYALAIPEADWVTQQWLQLAPKRDEQYGFASRAHRNNLAEPRPLDDEFRQLWRDMNTILERVLDAFKARYLTTHHLIDTRIVHGTDPLESRMDFFTQHIPHNPVTLTYFFTSIGEQQAIEWLRPLYEAGYFRTPPLPEYDAETKTTRYYQWPASQYLVQVAKLSPQQVIEIILDIPSTENVRVYEDCVDAACQIAPAIALQLVPRVIDWLQLPYQGLLADKVGALIDHLALGGESDAAMQLFAAFLDHFPDLRPTFDPWNYTRILRQTLPSLVAVAGLRTLTLLTGRLGECLPSDESDVAITYRYSSSWRPMIETIGEERMEEIGGIGHLLISLLRQAAELAIRQQLAPVKEILSSLQTHPSFVFSRLVLYLLSLFPDRAPELVASCLTDRQLFANAEVRREYVLLLQAAFGNLAPADQDTILGWIEQGPGDMAEAKAAYERYTHEPFTEEMETHHTRRWQRDWYARFGPALPAALQRRYEDLVQDYGPALLPETSFQQAITIGWGTTISPKTVEELCAMGARELVVFLKNWQPIQPDDPLQPSPSIRALSERLKNAAAATPQRFSRCGRQFRAVPPHYIEAILEGLIQAIKQGQAISWSGALDLCLSVARKRTKHTRGGRRTTQPQWKDACWQTIELLTLGCRAASPALPLTLRERVWTVLRPLTQDSNPTPREERPFDSDRSDRIDFAETTVRGKALFGVLAYAEWIMRPSGQEGEGAETSGQRQGGEGLPVEVQTVLEEHLDESQEPSPAVHTFYGQALPRLQVLDPAWVTRQRDRIFPAGEDVRPYRRAAWEAYCAFWLPNAALFLLLEGEYRYEIDALAGYTRANASAFEPEGRLVFHLIYLAWQGIIAPNEPDGLLTNFFAKAPPALRWLFWEEIGIGLARMSEPLAVDMLSRLQALWEWRVTALTRQSQQGKVEARELAPFRWWFKSGKFSAEWALRQLEATLRLYGTVDAPATMAERLAELSETAPLSTIRCLSLLLPGTHDEWKPSEWPQQVRTILGRALSSDDGEARQLAVEVIHRLGAQGEDYRDVLGKW